MKKILSVLLSIFIISGIVCVNAEELNVSEEKLGNVDSSVDAEDIIHDNNSIVQSFDKDYAVAFNDFENVESYSAQPNFPIENTGDKIHGKALYIPAASSAAITGSSTLGKYSWNGKEHQLFYEEITAGEDYIFAYEYWSDPNTSDNTNIQNVFSLAPCHNAFLKDTDYRHYPKYYGDNEWHQDAVAFTAAANESDELSVANHLNLKINALGSNVKSYLDNYLVIKAGEFIVEDTTDSVVISPLSNNIISANDTACYNGKNTYALGSLISFKVSAKNSAVAIKSVMMGETELVPGPNGEYSVKATDDIKIITSAGGNTLGDIYTIDENNNIFFNNKISLYELTQSLGGSNAFVAFRNGEAIAQNVLLSANDKICVLGNDSVQYNVKYIGDVAEDGEFTVSDVIALINRIYGDSQPNIPDNMYDLNCSKTVTVTDVVYLRKKILENS